MKTLFDAILKRRPAPKRARRRRRVITLRATPGDQAPALPRYERMKDTLLAEHGLHVQRWRTSMSGVAILAAHSDGTQLRLIEAPYPRGPVSAAVFCHEVGHHALGVGSIRPRCLEEHAAWMWSLDAMERFGIPVTERVRDRVERSLRHAVRRGRRAGLRRIPIALLPYAD